MRKLLAIIALFPLFTFAQKSGDLIEVEQKINLTPEGILSYFNEALNGDISPQMIDYVRRNSTTGLVAHKLTYWTKDYNDQPAKATGLVMWPKTNKKLSSIVYCHPTTNTRNNVPSNLNDLYGVGFLFPLSYALSEYIVIAPDFYGMGDGDGSQKYVERKTTADSIVDMITASNQFLDSINKERYNQYFLTGYSLGGHAAMSVLRKTTLENTYQFDYAYLGAGPHDLEKTQFGSAVLDKKTFLISSFLAYAVHTCDEIGYDIIDKSWQEVIAPKYYDKFIEATVEEKGGLLWGPPIWRNLFQPDFIHEIETNKNHPIYHCFRNSVAHQFYNTTPTTMAGSWFDSIIPDKHNHVAKQYQQNQYPWYDWNKYKIKTVNYGPFTHITGLVPWAFASTYRFNTLRKGGYFNLRAEYTSNNVRMAEEEKQQNSKQNKHFSRSSISPIFEKNSVVKFTKITDNQPSNQTRRVKEQETYQLQNLEEKAIYLAEVTRESGQKIIVPYMKETAIELKPTDMFTKLNEHTWEIFMHQLTDPVEAIHFYSTDQKLVKKIDVKDGLQESYSFQDHDLNGGERVEIITKSMILASTFEKNTEIDLSKDFVVSVKENQVHFQSKTYLMDNLTIFNTLGQRVYSQNNLQKNIHSVHLKQGIYFANILDVKGRKHLIKVVN